MTYLFKHIDTEYDSLLVYILNPYTITYEIQFKFSYAYYICLAFNCFDE